MRTVDDPSHMQEGTLVVRRWALDSQEPQDARLQIEAALRFGRLQCGNQPAHLKLETIAKRSGVRRPHLLVSRTRSQAVPLTG